LCEGRRVHGLPIQLELIADCLQRISLAVLQLGLNVLATLRFHHLLGAAMKVPTLSAALDQ
jgi:hypothetical protein